MKKLELIIAIVCFILGGCDSVNGYVIKGKVFPGDSRLVLTRLNAEGKTDTLHRVMAKNGEFRMKGKVGEVGICFLSVEKGKGRIPILLEDVVYKVDIRKNDVTDKRDYTVTGGTFQQILNDFYQKELEIFKERDSILNCYYKAEKEHDMVTKMHEAYELQVMGENYECAENKCIEDNRENIVGLCLIYKRLQYLNFERLKLKYDVLGENMKNTPEGKMIGERYVLLGKIKPGGQAPNIELKTLDGQNVSLYSLKGKIKIVDFWASWCSPCRRENTHLIELYKKYKDKGLVILGVSMDTNRDAWEKAVKVDGLEWTQVSDLNGFSGPVAREYKITAIPYIFVLDENNIVLGEKLRGKELDELLSKYL